VRKKKVKIFPKKLIIFTIIAIFLVLLIFSLLFNKKKSDLINENFTNTRNVTNITNATETTKPFQENVSRVPEGVVLIGRGGRIKIVGE